MCLKTGIFNFVKREKKELTESQSGKKKKKKLGTNIIDLSSTIFLFLIIFLFFIIFKIDKFIFKV